MAQVCKLFFDMCFYYTLSGFYLYLFTLRHPSIPGVPILVLCAAANHILKTRNIGIAEIAVGKNKTVSVAALLCCAAPALLFLFRPGLWQTIQYIPAWALLGYSILTDRVYTDRLNFEHHFAFTGKLLLLLLFGVMSASRVLAAAAGVLPYFIFYLLAGVCLMRILREDGKLSAGRNIVILLVMLAGGGALVFLQAPQFFLSAVGFVYNNIIVNIFLGILYVFGFLLVAIYWLFQRILSLFGSERYDVQLDMGGVAEEIFGEETVVALRSPGWLKYIFFALLGIAAAFLLFLILRRLLGAKSGDRRDLPYFEERAGPQKHERKRKAGFFRPREPRQAVRWYYRKYLKTGLSRGVKITPVDTSLTILKKSGNLFPGTELKQIRGLYISARYRYNERINESDAEAAADLLKKLRHTPDK